MGFISSKDVYQSRIKPEKEQFLPVPYSVRTQSLENQHLLRVMMCWS